MPNRKLKTVLKKDFEAIIICSIAPLSKSSLYDDSEIMNTVINEEMNTFANLKLSGKPKAIKITNNIE